MSGEAAFSARGGPLSDEAAAFSRAFTPFARPFDKLKAHSRCSSTISPIVC